MLTATEKGMCDIRLELECGARPRGKVRVERGDLLEFIQQEHRLTLATVSNVLWGSSKRSIVCSMSVVPGAAVNSKEGVPSSFSVIFGRKRRL